MFCVRPRPLQKLKHYSAKERQAASSIVDEIKNTRVTPFGTDPGLSLDNLEDYLLQAFPYITPYTILKTIPSKDLRDHIYDGGYMSEEVRELHTNPCHERGRGSRALNIVLPSTPLCLCRTVVVCSKLASLRMGSI